MVAVIRTLRVQGADLGTGSRVALALGAMVLVGGVLWACSVHAERAERMESPAIRVRPRRSIRSRAASRCRRCPGSG